MAAWPSIVSPLRGSGDEKIKREKTVTVDLSTS
jgi:hypothetical protein